MAGTIIVDRLESDASYASSINVASPMIVSNTINMTGGSITGNVVFDTNTMVIDSVGNRVRIGGSDFTETANQTNPAFSLEVHGNMRVGDGILAEQDIHFHNSGGIWQVGTNNSGPSSTNWFYIWRNGTGYTLRVDNAGRVIKPYQPSFFAKSLGNSQSNGGTTTAEVLLFSTIQENNGSHYNASTGRFTAPVAGYYYFAVSLLMDNNYNVTGAAGMIRVNDSSDRALCYCDKSSSQYLQTSTSCVVYLNVNDYVVVRSYITGIHNGGESSFTGFFIG
jgi:hypothetical protein